MKLSYFINALDTCIYRCDVQSVSEQDTSDGWKISIQGHTIDDSKYLVNILYDYLFSNNIPFKSATVTRFNLKDRGTKRDLEQSKKAMTIYCPNTMNIKDLCEKVYALTKDYKGWHSIDTPSSYEHYAGGLFFRNDRDIDGKYVRADN